MCDEEELIEKESRRISNNAERKATMMTSRNVRLRSGMFATELEWEERYEEHPDVMIRLREFQKKIEEEQNKTP